MEICLEMLALQAKDKIKAILYLVMQRAQLIKRPDKLIAKENSPQGPTPSSLYSRFLPVTARGAVFDS